jgi:tetratricopeptide (TPR) repeat protein
MGLKDRIAPGKKAKMQEFNGIQRERERRVVEIVRHFFMFTRIFRQLLEKHEQRSMHFSDLAKLVDDRGESILFTLKESCQNLFRNNSSLVSQKEQIFDLTIGSIFHLAMKLREDLYQLEFYGPKFSELGAGGDRSQGPENLIQEFKKIISRTQESFTEGVEEIHLLFQDVFRQFQELLGEYRENGLLARFLLEETDLVKEVFGIDAVEGVFRTLYGPKEAQGYRLAGESYFQSAFYVQAIKAFTRALEKSPGDESIQFKINLSQGMDQFYSFAPLQALRSFEKCLSLASKVEIVELHRDMIRKVCQKIQEEFPGRRKTDQHRDLVKKAKLLDRQLRELPPAPSDNRPA